MDKNLTATLVIIILIMTLIVSDTDKNLTATLVIIILIMTLIVYG